MEKIYIILTLFAICAFTFFLRSFFDSLPPDEDFGIYTYYPFFKNRGIKLVTDFWPGFPSTLLYIYAFLTNFFPPSLSTFRRFFSYFNFLLIFAAYYFAAGYIGPIGGLCCALIFSFYFSEPHLGSYFANQENFMIFFIMAGVTIIQMFTKNPDLTLIAAAGFLFGLGTLFKPVALIHLLFFGIYLYFFRNLVFSELITFLLAFISPIFIFLCAIRIKFREDIRAFWEQVHLRYALVLSCRNNIRETGKHLKENFIPSFKNSLFLWISPLILFFLCPTSPLWKVWFAAEITSLAAQGVFWDYHFIPLVPVLSGFSAAFLIFSGNTNPVAFCVGIALILHDLTRRYRFIFLMNRKQQIATFKKREQLFYAPLISRIIRQHTTPKDSIFVWGHLVQVYFLSQRPACDAFLFYLDPPYMPVHLKYFKHLLNRMREKPPAFLILSRPDFNVRYLEQLTGLRYCFFRRFGKNMAIYKQRCQKTEKNKRTEKELSLEDIRVLTKDPGNFYRTALKGFEHSTDKKTSQIALKSIMTLLKYKPLDIGGIFLLATWLKKEGKHKNSIRAFEKLIKLEPNDSKAHLELAELYFKAEKNKANIFILKAAQHFSIGLANSKSASYKVLCDAGEAWNTLQFEKGETLLEKATSISRGRLRCYYLLGSSLMRGNNRQKALYWFLRGVNERPVLPGEQFYRISLLYHSSHILYEQGNLAQAKNLLEQCIVICPQHEKAKELLLHIRGLVLTSAMRCGHDRS